MPVTGWLAGVAERPTRRSGLGVRVRATLGATFAFSIALGAGAWFVVDRQRSSLTEDVETTARLRTDDLISALATGGLPATVAVAAEERGFAQIVDDAGEVVRASPNIEGEPALVSFDVPATGFIARTEEVAAVSSAPFRVVGRQARSGRRVLRVYVGASLEPVEESVRNLRITLGAGAPLLLLIVAGLMWIVVGRALRPVDAISAEVERISERELHRRVPEPASDDEIARLAKTMNRMLERLDDAARRERRFVADASHEMRSPLTGIRAHLEVDLAHPETADWQTTEREVLDEALRLQRLVDDLLVLARAEIPLDTARRQLVDVDDLVLNEVRRLRIRGKVRLDATAVHAVQVVADADALTRVIHNLLDNAERHARSEVTVTVREHPAHVEITVADDGPGIPTEQRERIFERFARSDDARARDHGGAGLGLAIAREIVTAHAGTLTLDDTGAGRTRFVIRLPSAV